MIKHLTVTLIAASAVAACGGGDPEPKWESFEADGVGISFPAEVDEDTQAIDQLDAEALLRSAELGDDLFSLSTTPLPADAVFDLDGAVEGSVQGMGGTLDASETITVDGHDARRFTATVEQSGETAQVTSVITVTDAGLVQVIAIDVDGDDQAVVDQFVDSLSLA